mgnify:CR=1 FL=1
MAQQSSNGQFLNKQWVLSAMLPATKDILWRFSINRRDVCSCRSHIAGTQCQNQRHQIHVGRWCCVIRRGQRYVSRILVDKPCHHPQHQHQLGIRHWSCYMHHLPCVMTIPAPVFNNQLKQKLKWFKRKLWYNQILVSVAYIDIKSLSRLQLIN